MLRLASTALTLLVFFSPSILALVALGGIRRLPERTNRSPTIGPFQLWETLPQSVGAEDSTNDPTIKRRSILATALLLPSVIVIGATPVRAVKPRNEALCDTGLFDNFLEYRCTPLGNIEDEGAGRKMSESEESATNSLMSKLMMDQNIDSVNERTKPDSSSKEDVDNPSKESSNFARR